MDKDIEDFNTFIDNFNNRDLPSALLKTGEEVGDILHNNIKEMIYEGEFQPNFYERREESGGFGDRRNIIITPVDSHYIKVENVATGDSNYIFSDAPGERLDEIIETGKGYSWTHNPNARPVFSMTEAELNDGALQRSLKKTLSEVGYEII